MAFKWYPFNIMDFRKDTYHLSAAAEGIYRRLIDEYMLTGGSLPDNDGSLAGIARVEPCEWDTHSKTIRAFFKAQNGRLFHKRCEIELHSQAIAKASRTARGKLGGLVRWGKLNNYNGMNSTAIAEPCSSYSNAIAKNATLTLSKKERGETGKELSPSPALTETLKQKGWIPQ